MNLAYPAFRRFLTLSTAALFFFVPWAPAQLQPSDAKPAPAEKAPTTVAPEQTPTQETTVERSGTAQAPPGEGASIQPAPEIIPSPEKSAAAQPAPAGPAPEQSKSSPQDGSNQATVSSSGGQVVSPDFSAFVAALAAAERTNENLSARLAQIEASNSFQRERDQLFIRDVIRGVLLLAGGMATIGMLALVAIVYLQVRSTKQQALTFAAQLQALTAHAALAGPSGMPTSAIQAVQNQFESTAHKIEQKLSDLEALASGLPGSGGSAPSDNPPAVDLDPHASSDYTAPLMSQSGASRGEKSSDLLAKANALLIQQQPEVALAYLDQAILHNPHNLQAHLKKGAALERLNRLQEAITAYDCAIESDQSLSVAFLAKAGVLNKLQRYGEALKCYEAALSQQGGQAAKESPAA